MAKAAISTGNATTLRNNRHSISRIALNIVAPQTIAALSVTGIPAKYPFPNLTVSGSMSAVSVGQLVRVYSGTTTKTWAVVRKAPSGSTLYISPVALGDPGYPEPIENAIEVGDSVTVYSHRPLFGLYSTIQQRTFYKQWDIPYSNQNSTPPPVANAGEWQEAAITSGTASFTLPRDGANSSFALGSATIASYSWTLPTGVALAAGYNATDAVIAVDADPGQHLVALTVTDSNAITHTAYTWLFVADSATYTAFGASYAWTIDNDTQTLTGREMTLSITHDGALGFDAILPHAGVLFTVEYDYQASIAADVAVDTFIGYVTDMSHSHNGEYSTTQLTVQAPCLVASKIPIPSQLLTEVSSPANWTQCNSVLSNPRGALYYAIKWHCPSLLDMHDLDAGSLTTPRKKSYEYNASNLLDAMQVAARAILGNVGSASDGTTVLRQNPNYESNSFRNALATVWTWLVGDIQAPLSYQRRLLMELGEVRGGGFAYNGTTIGAWAAIKKWGQGVGRGTVQDFSVTFADGLTRVKEVIGHYYAEQNAPIQGITLKAARALDFTEPVYLLWHKLNIAASYDPRGKGWSDTRVLPQQVRRAWDIEGGTVAIDVTVKPETFGQPGEELPIGSAASSISNGWAADVPVPYEPEQDSIPNLILTWNGSGQLGRTQTFLDVSPSWNDLSPLFDGDVCDVCWDYNSDFFTAGYVLTEALGAYVATADGASLNVYRVADVREPTPTVTLLHTYTMADSSTDTTARIQCSKETPTLVGVLWHDQDGTSYGYSDDGGATWETAAALGSAITDTANDNAEIGLAVEDTNQLGIAPDSGSDYGLYLATSAGGGFSALSGIQRSPTPGALVMPNGAGDVWVSVPETAGSDITVTLDAGGYATYAGGTTDLASKWTASVYDDGDPHDNVQRSTKTGAGGVGTGNVYLDIQSITSVPGNTVSVDYRITWPSDYPGDFTVRLRRGTVIGTIMHSVTIDGTTDRAALSGVWQNAEYTDATGSTQYTAEISVGNGVALTTTLDLDNLSVDQASGAANATLYRVDDYASSPTWNDQTPGTDHIPAYPYALAVDLADTDNIEAMATNDTDTRWYSSTDAGDNWTDNGETDYRVVKRAGDILLLAGVNALDVSVDAGANVIDRRGDLAAVWGSIGTIRGMLALI